MVKFYQFLKTELILFLSVFQYHITFKFTAKHIKQYLSSFSKELNWSSLGPVCWCWLFLNTKTRTTRRDGFFNPNNMYCCKKSANSIVCRYNQISFKYPTTVCLSVCLSVCLCCSERFRVHSNTFWPVPYFPSLTVFLSHLTV